MVLKAELHAHLEGTASPDLVKRLAQRNSMNLPDGLFDAKGNYRWTTFLEFLKAYDLASAVIKTPLDYRDVTYEYLKQCASEGAIYVEVMSSPDHAAMAGMGYQDHLDGIIAGIDDAERDFGIVGRIIVTCVRHLGPEQATEVAKQTIAAPHPYVVGFGMGGDENAHHPSDFSKAFHIAHDAGLACNVHAGEMAGPESIIAALDHLPVKRTYLTGVVIDDEDGDEFYDMGEGQGGVHITAFDGETAYATATWAAGGYTLALPPGTYRVVFEGGELDQPYETEVTIGNENVKLDVIEESGGVVASLNAGVPLPGVEVTEEQVAFDLDEADLELGLFDMV